MDVDKFAAFHTGFLCANAHEVAFHRGGEGRFLRGRTRQHTVKGVDESCVAAAVTVALFVEVGKGIVYGVLTKFMYGEGVACFVQNKLSKRTVEAISSSADGGKRISRNPPL